MRSRNGIIFAESNSNEIYNQTAGIEYTLTNLTNDKAVESLVEIMKELI